MSFVMGQVVRIVRRSVEGEEGNDMWAPSMDQTVGELGWVTNTGARMFRLDVAAVENWWYYPLQTLTAITEGPVSRSFYRDLVAQEERNG